MHSRRATILWLAAGLMLFLTAYLLWVEGHMLDFEVDYVAGTRFRQGENLYRPEDGHFMYKYSPGVAFLEMPISLLPLPVAKFVFYTLLTGCMIAVFALSYFLLPPVRPIPITILIPTFLVLGRFFFREILLGQVNLIIAVLLLLMLTLLHQARGPSTRLQAAAGVLWATATILKPYALVFLPYFLMTRRWRLLTSALLLAALSFLIPVSVYGWQGNLTLHKSWIDALSISTPPLLTNPVNISILGLFSKWTGNERLSWILTAATMTALAPLVFAVVRQGRTLDNALVLDGALLLTLIPLLSPLGWDYQLLMAVLAVMLLIQQRGEFSPPWRYGLIATLGAFFPPWIIAPLHRLYLAWSVETLLALALIGFLAGLRFKEISCGSRANGRPERNVPSRPMRAQWHG